ncbi:MAG: hypothetical protein P1V20_10955, partial [Verrucomicrobiales bacterium]|nr:hypothetical protein [Verrucomicrobiales bacterium]
FLTSQKNEPKFTPITVVAGGPDKMVTLSKTPGGALENIKKVSLDLLRGKADPNKAIETIFGNSIQLKGGTEVLRLEENVSPGLPENTPTNSLLESATKTVKVRVLNGIHKDQEGWIAEIALEDKRAPEVK